MRRPFYDLMSRVVWLYRFTPEQFAALPRFTNRPVYALRIGPVMFTWSGKEVSRG